MAMARVYVTLKKSVFDPQGKTIHEALRSLGYASVADVRQGKYFEVVLDGMEGDDARKAADEIARRVLSNPVIESYRVELDR
jgi:phosphoribosylformylglycinamidine synthase